MRRAILTAALALAGCVAPAARVPAPRPPDAATSAPEPAEPRPLAALIAADPALSRFRLLAATGGLDRLIAGRGPVTVLAPTDAAFALLPAGTVEALLQPGNRPSLLHLLRYWTVIGTVSPADLAERVRTEAFVRLPTLEGEPVTVTAATGGAIVVDAAGRRGHATAGATASDGALIELNGIIGPRSIEPRTNGSITR